MSCVLHGIFEEPSGSADHVIGWVNLPIFTPTGSVHRGTLNATLWPDDIPYFSAFSQSAVPNCLLFLEFVGSYEVHHAEDTPTQLQGTSLFSLSFLFCSHPLFCLQR